MKKSLLLLGSIILLAFALRLCRIDAVSLRGDEAFTVIFVQRTWDGLWKGIRLVEPNPPLLYLTLRVWVAVAGASEFATRYFSLFFGVLCVPLLYRLAREMLRPLGRHAPAALVAAGLGAINPYQIWHSQDVRNYTMWPALCLLALVFWWRWWRGPSETKTRLLVFYFLATTASLYTHYYDTFILVAENIFVYGLGALQRRWGALAQWTAAQVALALVYVPWVLWGTNRVQTYGEPSAEQSIPLLDQFARTLSTLVLSDTLPEALRMALWVPLLIGVLAVLLYMARRSSGREPAVFFSLYVVIPTLALYAISVGRPLFLERYLNAIAPAYYMLFGIGIAALSQWRLGRYASAAVLIFFVAASGYALANYFGDPAYAKAPDWRALGKYISERAQPGDIIVQNFNEMAPQYYRSTQTPIVTIPRDFWPMPADEKTLEQLNQDYSRIWFLPAARDSWDPIQFVEHYLARRDERDLDTSIANLQLQLYTTPREFESLIRPVNAQIGQATLVGFRIAGVDRNETRVTGDSLTVFLYWRALQRFDGNLKVFVHLMDSDQHVASQRDGIPANGMWPTREWVPGETIVDGYTLPLDALKGEFALVVGLYDPETLVRAPAFNANGSPLPENRVPMTKVIINP